jgi:multidrug efflux pump
MSNKKPADLLNDPVPSLIYKQTIPIMLAGLLTTSYGFIDMIFASRLGVVQVASIAFISPLFIMLSSLAMGVSRGGISIIAKLLGQDKKEEAADYATQLRLVIITLALLFSLVGTLFAPAILRLIRISDELYDQALIYGRIRFLSVPFTLGLSLYMTLFKSQGKMEIASRISLLGVVGNAVLNGFCLYVLKMGIDGLAYATLCTKILQTIVIILTYNSGEHEFEIKWRVSPQVNVRAIWLHLLKVGLPLSFTQASTHFGFLVLNMFIVNYSHQAVAAFAIGNRINSLLFFPSKEIGQGLIPLIAKNWGKKYMGRVREVIKRGLVFSLVFGVFAAFVIQTIKFPLGRFLTKGDPLTYEHVLNYVGLVGWTVIAWAIFHTLQAIFTSFQRTSFTLIVTSVRLWGIRIPGILIFQKFFPSLGEFGVWYTMFISNMLTLIFAVVYFAIKVPPLLADKDEGATIASLTPLPLEE